ncbi:hypothetical protein [Cellvibrio mixtus]|uniref:hypothetical protein n=1 Tax=Cellvibrio mixtus TaxID=39650 RepID=UPI00113FF8C0|nr:hypothetical protein [Cellvibrio mixtus]
MFIKLDMVFSTKQSRGFKKGQFPIAEKTKPAQPIERGLAGYSLRGFFAKSTRRAGTAQWVRQRRAAKIDGKYISYCDYWQICPFMWRFNAVQRMSLLAAEAVALHKLLGKDNIVL